MLIRRMRFCCKFPVCIAMCLTVSLLQAQTPTSKINLPSSKQLLLPMPGGAQKTNSQPAVLAVSPDGRYVVSVNTGYGTFDSHYMQSLTVLDTQSGKLKDMPDARTLVGTAQVLFSGIAFSRDGKHVYVSMASTSVPDGGKDKAGRAATGNGIAVYTFGGGELHAESFLPIPLQQLALGRTTHEIDRAHGGDKGVPFPAGLAVTVGADGSEQILVADNLSDDAVLLDAASGKILTRFDLAESDAVPSTYPIAVAVTSDGRRGYVALWNSSDIAELDLRKGVVAGTLQLLKPADAVKPGTHPAALCFSRDGGTLYVALANRDVVAAVDIAPGKMKLRGLFDTRLPHQTYFGAEPQSIVVSADGSRMYVANGGSDAIAVFDPRKLTNAAAAKGMIEPRGFVPTEWYPTALALSGSKLYVTTAKGLGTGPNDFAQRHLPDGMGEPTIELQHQYRAFTYSPTLLYGSLATLDTADIQKHLPQWTEEVMLSNRMRAAEEKISFAAGGNPIRHVIYIIKENRTYDQVYGDLQQNGKRVGNGDPALTMYGEAVTPNLHQLALQFGVFDNFYDSGEVSGQGHVWSTAGIVSDYMDKTLMVNYRSNQRTYDYEGMVAAGYPLQQKIADVNEPASGYLWTNLAAHGKTYYHFGEYISSTFCKAKAEAEQKTINPTQGAMNTNAALCLRSVIRTGEQVPAVYGGGVSLYPWEIPMLASNTPTKQELVGHYEADYPDFNLKVPDQFRVEVFLHRLAGWKADRAAGKDTMPEFVMLRLGNDHTAGTKAGSPAPKASVADNDLAVGRAVEAISNSAYWDDTAFFILEDDAQNGGDHVDAHRSTALVISKYSPRGSGPFVDSRFYTTVSMLRTMETLLGLPPMNNNDAFAPLMTAVFGGAGEQPAFHADYRNRDNQLIYTANQKNAPGAKESAKMDFTHADQADARKLNVVLWKDAMGEKPIPPMILLKPKKGKDDDD
jgi:DNA-binding beta-propeller fold protein YncE